MAEVLLINPRRRRKARKAKVRRTRRSYAARSAPKRRRARRRNPVSMRAVTRVRKNPLRRRSRSRNPIRLGGLFAGVVPMVRDAAFGAAGSVAVDFAFARVNPMLPAMLQSVPGRVGAGDAIKAVATVALGRLLSRFTKGASMKMAQGALTVQADRIVRSFLPATITAQLGYAVPGAVTNGSNRLNPNALNLGMGAYLPRGRTALLNGVGAYTRAMGPSPLLSSARTRENVLR